MERYKLKFNYKLLTNGLGEVELEDGRRVEFIGRIFNEWDKVEGYFINPGDRIERGMWEFKEGLSCVDGIGNLVTVVKGDNVPYPRCHFKLRNGNVGYIEEVHSSMVTYSIVGYEGYASCSLGEFSEISTGVDYSKYMV